MKEKIANEIKQTFLFGMVIPDEIKRFDDTKFCTKENLFENRLSQIKFFIGEKNGKEIILGLQTFYSNKNGKDIPNEEARDKSEKELDIKILKIPPNDYICNFFVSAGDDHITQIKLVTNKGTILKVGNDKEKEIFVNYINDNKDNMILYFFGGYRKCLEAIGAGYIPLKSYLGATSGYFELKKKVKNKAFRDAIQAKIKKLSESDRILFRVCTLPESCFYSIIRYCLL